MAHIFIHMVLQVMFYSFTIDGNLSVNYLSVSNLNKYFLLCCKHVCRLLTLVNTKHPGSSSFVQCQ